MKYLIIISILLTGCLTQKNLPKHNDKFPEKAAEYAADKFPCITKDSQVTEIFDSTQYLTTIEDLSLTVKFLNQINDSLLKALLADSNCKHYSVVIDMLRYENIRLQEQIKRVKPVIKEKLVVRTVEDSAAKFALLSKHGKELEAKQKELDKNIDKVSMLEKQKEELQSKLDKRTKKMWLFLWIAVGLAIWNFRKQIISLLARLIVPVKIPPV